MGATDNASPARGGESVGGLVALKYGVVFVFERDRCRDRSEDLLARNPHIVVHVSEQCRLDKIAFARSGLAADRNLGAFLLADVEIALDAVELLARDDRSHSALLIKRVAHAHVLTEASELTDHLVILVTLHEDPRAGAADLPRVEEDTHHRGRHRLIQIGVGKDDVWRLAAELERYLLKVSCRGLQDELADLGRAGKSDFVDLRMLGD